MANSIEFAKNYTGILDEVYQRAVVSRCLNSGGRMARADRNAKEIFILKISVTELGDYTRNVGYKTGSITYEHETHSFGVRCTSETRCLYGRATMSENSGRRVRYKSSDELKRKTSQAALVIC
jgi:hypothetical protein